MPRRFVLAFCAAALGGALAACAPMRPVPAIAPTAPAKVVVQVSDDNPRTWTLALNNIRNVQQELGPTNVVAEVVAYGPGIAMLKRESMVEPRVTQALTDGVRVVACENTMNSQKLTRSDMIPGIHYVHAGVVELMQRQQEGYSYIRP